MFFSRMKLCPLHTDRWEFAPPVTSNTEVITIVITTPVLLPIMLLLLRQEKLEIVKRMNSYFEGIKNMWMAKLSLFSPLPFSYLTLVIGSITFWTCLQHNRIVFNDRFKIGSWTIFLHHLLLERRSVNIGLFSSFCCVPKKSFFLLFQNFFFNVVSIVKLRQI